MADEIGDTDMLNIEVVYAKPDEQTSVRLSLPPGTTAEQAVQRSGLLTLYPEIDPMNLKLGVFGVACQFETVLKDGDRVEIYRPLLNDPKTARRQRALSKRS